MQRATKHAANRWRFLSYSSLIFSWCCSAQLEEIMSLHSIACGAATVFGFQFCYVISCVLSPQCAHFCCWPLRQHIHSIFLLKKPTIPPSYIDYMFYMCICISAYILSCMREVHNRQTWPQPIGVNASLVCNN